MDIHSLTILVVASVYAMLSLLSLVMLARRVSMLDYCLRELEKKMPILIPSDLAAKAQDAAKPAEPAVETKAEPSVVVAASGLTAPIGSIDLVKKPEPKAKSKKAPKAKATITKKGKK